MKLCLHKINTAGETQFSAFRHSHFLGERFNFVGDLFEAAVPSLRLLIIQEPLFAQRSVERTS